MKIIVCSIMTLLMMSFTTREQVPATQEPEWKLEFLSRINNIRQKGCNCGGTYMPPVSPLVWNDQLQNSAYGHARDMADKRYFSHTSQDGRKLRDRVLAMGYSLTGYRSYIIGENIAQGQRSIKEVMEDWLKSESHCKNLMNPAYREVGVGFTRELYWVQDFGGKVPFKPETTTYSR